MAMNKGLTQKEVLSQQEKLYQFDRFTREDALRIGLLLHENAQKYPEPVAIEITINGLVVFRYFPEGTMQDNALWLTRKRHTVELMQMSSLHFLMWLQENGETLESRKLMPNDYAAGGGGFPIAIRGTGVIGSICVSGLPDHKEDHQLLVDTLAAYISSK